MIANNFLYVFMVSLRFSVFLNSTMEFMAVVLIISIQRFIGNLISKRCTVLFFDIDY